MLLGELGGVAQTLIISSAQLCSGLCDRIYKNFSLTDILVTFLQYWDLQKSFHNLQIFYFFLFGMKFSI